MFTANEARLRTVTQPEIGRRCEEHRGDLQGAHEGIAASGLAAAGVTRPAGGTRAANQEVHFSFIDNSRVLRERQRETPADADERLRSETVRGPSSLRSRLRASACAMSVLIMGRCHYSKGASCFRLAENTAVSFGTSSVPVG